MGRRNRKRAKKEKSRSGSVTERPTVITGSDYPRPSITGTFVFVYGSLKSGFHRGNAVGLYRNPCIGAAQTVEAIYLMKSYGEFPGVLLNGDRSIQGEVYVVDARTLVELDQIEGHPKFYQRQQIMVSLDSGESVIEAWMYVLPEPNRYVLPTKYSGIETFTNSRGMLCDTWVGNLGSGKRV